MTQNLTRQRDVTIYASGVISAIWVVLAFIDPETHYYMAPFLAALAFPLTMRVKAGKQPGNAAIGAGLGGMIPVLIVTGLLSSVGRLKGPALFSWGGPASEALVFAAFGGVLGALIAYTPTPRRLRS